MLGLFLLASKDISSFLKHLERNYVSTKNYKRDHSDYLSQPVSSRQVEMPLSQGRPKKPYLECTKRAKHLKEQSLIATSSPNTLKNAANSLMHKENSSTRRLDQSFADASHETTVRKQLPVESALRAILNVPMSKNGYHELK